MNMPPAIKNAINTTIIAIGMSFCQDRYIDWFIGQYHGSSEPITVDRLGGSSPHSSLGAVGDAAQAMYPDGQPFVGPVLWYWQVDEHEYPLVGWKHSSHV
jgi:hypothetical protein